jgi:rod shape-determining protein MreD
VNAWRAGALAALVCGAVVAQSVVFRHVAVDGVVPNLALVLVVVAAIARGPLFGAYLGFGTGLLLDVAPPADTVAGRWALALVLVGYLAGRVRQDARGSTLTAVLVVGAASFVGSSVYALSGVVTGDGRVPLDSMIQVIVIGVLWDLLLAPLLVPLLFRAFDAVEPTRVPTRVL